MDKIERKTYRDLLVAARKYTRALDDFATNDDETVEIALAKAEKALDDAAIAYADSKTPRMSATERALKCTCFRDRSGCPIHIKGRLSEG